MNQNQRPLPRPSLETPPTPSEVADDQSSHPGISPQPRDTNRLATAALITGVLGMFVFAVPLGLVALGQIKTRGQAGRGQAVGGLVASVFWAVVAVAVLIGGVLLSDKVSAPTDSAHSIPTSDVKIGDCVEHSEDSDRIQRVTVVPCDQQHDAEAITEVFLDGPWPGLSEVKRRADNTCTDKLVEALDRSPVLDQLRTYVLYPSNEIMWRTTTRASCLVIDGTGGKLVGKIPR